MILNKTNTKQYQWGNNCNAWELFQSKNAIIKEEIMPPQTDEQLHLHKKTEQFFYILEGKATFIVDGKKEVVSQNEGIQIKIEHPHKICNDTSRILRFLVISFPGNVNDRINLEQ
ncbi:cupin domain-containing protein [Arenibacter sp. M-2]|uniref:cupin domain-containing protein n=1 Tax=Arenibacter sp. M-2 TaxID=3053612 RepID=UPI002570715C|nr:cupin domain-containing protein [Arenibacter sp. M-2]MDL5511234.1 cupin domain-containing protein [Arenibacter sp. M-2]